MTRRPYSFGGDRIDNEGPRVWMWGGPKGDNFAKFRSACRKVGIADQEIDTFSSAAGMRSAVVADQRVLSAFSTYKASLGNSEPFGAASVQRLLQGMEKAEAEGLCGHINPSGAKVTALMWYLDYRGHQARGEMRTGMETLGRTTSPPIAFNVDVEFENQPVDSQRLLQWAGRFGKQEQVVGALARLHFEEQTSVTKRSTLLKAAREVGLDTEALSQFLDSDELVKDVWKSYGETINKHGIHAIPFFVFNGSRTNGGPFRDGTDSAVTVRGSADVGAFVSVFEKIFAQGVDICDESEELEEEEGEEEEEDFGRLPEDPAPFPERAPLGEVELSEEQLDIQAAAKEAAAEALHDGHLDVALVKYTEAIKIGNPTAMLYGKRAELLLKLRRPRACIEDCTGALAINPDSGKAFRIRGKAHRRLGNWREAHHDLSMGQKLDFDDETVDEQKFVAEKWRKINQKMTRQHVKEERKA